MNKWFVVKAYVLNVEFQTSLYHCVVCVFTGLCFTSLCCFRTVIVSLMAHRTACLQTHFTLQSPMVSTPHRMIMQVCKRSAGWLSEIPIPINVESQLSNPLLISYLHYQSFFISPNFGQIAQFCSKHTFLYPKLSIIRIDCMSLTWLDNWGSTVLLPLYTERLSLVSLEKFNFTFFLPHSEKKHKFCMTYLFLLPIPWQRSLWIQSSNNIISMTKQFLDIIMLLQLLHCNVTSRFNVKAAYLLERINFNYNF